jgi:hypothetical protein
VSDIWALLGIAPTTDERSIKKAYATQVRVYRPDTHPQEFSQLRQAYELALHLRHAEPVHEAEPAAEAPPESAPQPAETVASEQAAQPAAAPSEAYVMLDSLAQCYREQGEVEATTLMHAQIASLSSKTIDTRLDYEGMLLSSLLNHTQPPLLITFEAARQFQWASHMHDVEQQVGSYGARRLTVLLELSNRAVFSKRFSSNRWINRLFEANPHLPRIGFLPDVKEAQQTGMAWLAWCDEAQLPELKQQLNTTTMDRIDKLILTTDVWLALLVGWLFWIVFRDTPKMQHAVLLAVGTIASSAIFVTLPLCWRRIRAQPWMLERLHRPVWGSPPPQAKWQSRMEMGFIGIIPLSMLSVIFLSSDAPAPLRLFSITYFVLLGVLISCLVLAMVWRVILFVEQLASNTPLKLRGTSDVYAFEQLRQSRVAQWPALRWQQRLKNLPAAWSSERKKAKLRKQEAAQRSPVTSTPEKASNWMWLWFAAMLLIAAMRTISAK